MTHMICRTRVANFDVWRGVFDSHADAHREAGLKLINLWRAIEEPNNVFFIFEVADISKAEAFLNSPQSARAGEEAGVIDGEYHFAGTVAHY